MKNIRVGLALLSLASTFLHVEAQGLKDTVGKHFLMGTAINVSQTAGTDSLSTATITRHFNCIVAENCMKPEGMQPQEGKFKWRKAERFVKFGEDRGMTVIGHVLVWHSQTPDWFFKDTEGKPATKEQLIERMRTHILTVVGHFKGRIKGWDVVNEAIEDNGTYRQSPWYQIIGPEYIELAFRFAHEADPDAELYYNDYSMSNPAKREKVCQIVNDLKAKGLRIDGVGMQSHNGLSWPNLSEYEASIDAFADCGVKVMITELDLNVLPNPDSFGGAEVSQNFEYNERMDPYKNGLSADMEQRIYDRWIKLFDIYKRHEHQISRICLWGVSDGQSWMNDWPIQGRTAYPLLFDRQYQPKPVVNEIIKMYE
ncbi:MAG: endo-1,4-beta-xylanase [Prevotella sp.]|nr:endo-1,4-beta-xylanase [Prevotella sp.]